MWYLFLFVMAVFAAFFIWDFRRKVAAREAASKQRFEEMLVARPAAPPRIDSPPTAPSPAVTQEAKVAAASAPASAALSATGRFLGQRETLLYRLLKAGIPDHEIFANATLASVLGGKSEPESRRLAQYRVDFVVCDKAMQVVAVVEIESSGNLQTVGDQRFKTDSLKAGSIRLVRFNAAALPRRDEIRALICGPGVSVDPAVKE